MFIYVNAKGRERLAPSVRKNTGFGTMNVVPKGFVSKPGRVEIGRGAYGVIYASYRNKTMKNINVRKVSLVKNKKQFREFNITRKIYKIVPKHVVNIRSLSGTNMVMNMYRGGAIGDWLKQNPDVNDDVMRLLILQVITTLFKIYRSDRSFRHNDLHLGNVFIDDRSKQERKFGPYSVPDFGISARLADFGLAFDSQFPSIENFKNYGIYTGNDKMYDAHLFLNSLYDRIVKKKSTKFPITAKFLSEILKGGYSGRDTKYVSHYRLKVSVKFPHDYEYLIGHPYFAVPYKKAKTVQFINNKLKKIISKNLNQKNIRNWGGNYNAKPFKASASFLLKPPKYSPTRGIVYSKSPTPRTTPIKRATPKSATNYFYNPVSPSYMTPKPKPKTPSPPKKTIYNFINESNFKTLKPRNIYNKLVELKEQNPKQRTKNIVETIVKHGDAWEKAKAALRGIANVTKQ